MHKGSLVGRWARRLLSLYPLVLIACAWELASRLGGIPPVFLPPLSIVLGKLWAATTSGEMPLALGVSLYRTAIGLLIAAILGITLGFLTIQSKTLRWLSAPILRVGFPTPKIALLPLFTLWFGIDHASKIALVAATCFFPFFVAAQSAAAGVSSKLVWAALSLGTSRTGLLARVVLPASLPSIVSGLRVAVPMGLITVFTAEMLTGGGIGENIILAQRYFETDTVFAYLIVTVVVGYVLDDALSRYQKAIRQ